MFQSNFIPQGWECPKCKRVYSPTTNMCSNCPTQTITTSSTNTNNKCQFYESNGTSGICKKCGEPQINHAYSLYTY